MKEHILITHQPAKATPAKILPDGLITGNGDVTATLAGTADRVRIYIGKTDFWKADERCYTEFPGGIAPLGLVEFLLPHMAYATYTAEQDLDRACIRLSLVWGRFYAKLKIMVCAEQNTVLFELDRSHPMISASVSLIPLEGYESTVESGNDGEVRYTVRGFDTPECRYPNYGICALRQITASVSDGNMHTVWAMQVCTNHDTAAYRRQAIEAVSVLKEADCKRLYRAHDAWWDRFWSKSGVSLPDEKLELYWYAGIYATACCMRNKKFPPGLWGAYATADGMGWFGDYHLNYNFEAPFYGLTGSNHTELIECYAAPIMDYLPIAKRYAAEYLGIDGCYFPVGIGPFGMEAGIRPDIKEHGRLFHGQKSNAAYAAVIPMMHWYGTRDKAFARREYYDFLLSVAEFWENYLVFEEGEYRIYNDSLNETAWFCSPDYLPEGHDDNNPIVSLSLVRMVMKLMIDLSEALESNIDRIPKWQHILDHLREVQTFASNGEMLLRPFDDSEEIRELTLEAMYPIGAIGKYSTPALYEAAKNTHKRLSIWDSDNRFCSYYPMAARLEYPPQEIIAHIHEVIEKRGLPNGMFCYGGGGLENSSAVPNTVNEMLLQSYEGILRFFPVWDRKQDASFFGLRAKGAFVVDAVLEGGRIEAKIVSEQGMPLTVEVPSGGCVLTMGDGSKVSAAEGFCTVQTQKGEKILFIAGNLG